MTILLGLWLNIFNITDTLVDMEKIVEPVLEDKIEQMVETDETTIDWDIFDIMEELEYFVRHPINVNSADAKQLKKLFFLNEQQLLNLKRYIADYGAIVGLHELQYIHEFD